MGRPNCSKYSFAISRPFISDILFTVFFINTDAKSSLSGAGVNFIKSGRIFPPRAGSVLLLPENIRNFLDTDFDLNENGISGDLYDIMGASLFIRANYPESYTDVSVSAAPENIASFPKGDANCDSKVSVADAVAILQFIGNRDKYDLTPQGKKNADVNGDGSVTGKDALEIQKMDAGVIVIK